MRVSGLEVDFLWRAAKLIVEVDGHTFHGHRAAFERDRRRDQILAAAGYRVIRVTWRQLVQEPVAVAVRLGQALAHDPRVALAHDPRVALAHDPRVALAHDPRGGSA